jgi:hypothetical protein
MLEESAQNGRDDLICWLPCGTRFKIGDQQEFAETIMSKYCRHSKYKSFLRQLSMYKFQRASSGPSKGCYYHPHFLRHRLDLANYINRETIQSLPASTLHNAGNNTQTPTLQLDESPIFVRRSFMDYVELFVSSFSVDDDAKNVVSLAPASNGIVPDDEQKPFHPVSISSPLLAPSTLCASGAPTTPEDIVDEIIFTFRLSSEDERPGSLPFVSEEQVRSVHIF